MTAKEYLSQVRIILKRLDNLNNTLEEIRGRITSTEIAYDQDRVQTSTRGDGIPAAVVRMMEVERRLSDLAARYIEIKADVVETINMLTNVNYMTLLYKRYIELKRFEQISIEMGYAYQYIINLHGWALKAIDTIIRKRKKML